MSMGEEQRTITESGPEWNHVSITNGGKVAAMLQVRNGCPIECLQALYDQLKEMMEGPRENGC